MPQPIIGTIKSLQYYPIKGLSAVSVDSVDLKTDDGFPGDRLFGFAKANSGFDQANPKPLPKQRFLVLMRYAKLAELNTTFDMTSRELLVSTHGQEALRADLSSQQGQQKTSTFFSDLLDLQDHERPFFAEAQPHRFTDVSVVSETMMNAVSLINLASIRELEKRIGSTVDPRRFRGNIVFDGWPPFSELELVGKTIKTGDLKLEIVMRTKRCAATEVNPDTAERDLKLPKLLMQEFGHFDMGVYARVVAGGTIRTDAEIEAECPSIDQLTKTSPTPLNG